MTQTGIKLPIKCNLKTKDCVLIHGKILMVSDSYPNGVILVDSDCSQESYSYQELEEISAVRWVIVAVPQNNITGFLCLPKEQLRQYIREVEDKTGLRFSGSTKQEMSAWLVKLLTSL